jgi:uncharacterized protein YqgV (UPF0045/DUF77 family)
MRLTAGPIPTLPRVPRVRVEFTVEPFTEGAPGPHVMAAEEAVRARGLQPDVGPFGTALEAEAGEAAGALCDLVGAALERGATGVAVQVRLVADPVPDAAAHPLLAALAPVAVALGADLVTAEAVTETDLPLIWEGECVGGLRLPRAQPGLGALVAQVEQQLGGRLRDLDRVAKQRAVRLLEERGAFNLRRSIDDVADAMGVSRITVYNYLNATRSGG